MDPTWSEEEAIQWVVSVFPDAHAHLSDLGTDLCDGVLLVALVSRLSHADARLIIENPSNLKERTLNAREAIFLARSLGVKRKINAEDIVSGNAAALKDFIWYLKRAVENGGKSDEASLAASTGSGSKKKRKKRKYVERQSVVAAYHSREYSTEQIIVIQACFRRHLVLKATKKLKKTMRHRNRCASEILDSEIVYVSGLKLLVVHKEQLEFSLKVSPDPLATREEIQLLFSNADQIYHFNQLILDELKQRVGDWSYRQLIGDIFVAKAPYLKLYIQYCNDYDKAVEALRKMKQRSVFVSFLETVMAQADPSMASLTLESFLIMPVQRVPRYILLLKDLLSNTDHEHPDYENLGNALRLIQSTANKVNNSIREAEAMNKVYSIQEKLTGTDVPTLMQASRRFVKEGPLTVCHLDSKKGKEFQRYIFYLFNDALVYASEQQWSDKLTFKAMIQFSANVKVKELPDMEIVSNLFMIVSPQKTLTLSCDSLEQKTDWMITITNLLAQSLQARMTRGVDESSPQGAATEVGWSVSIIGTEVRKDKAKKPFTVYVIQVVHPKRTYHVIRRYSEFDALYNKLKKTFPHLKFVSLPKKHILGNLGTDIVESRRVVLETFLEDILIKPEVSSCSDFVIFLQPSDNYSEVEQLKEEQQRSKEKDRKTMVIRPASIPVPNSPRLDSSRAHMSMPEGTSPSQVRRVPAERISSVSSTSPLSTSSASSASNSPRTPPRKGSHSPLVIPSTDSDEQPQEPPQPTLPAALPQPTLAFAKSSAAAGSVGTSPTRSSMLAKANSLQLVPPRHPAPQPERPLVILPPLFAAPTAPTLAKAATTTAATTGAALVPPPLVAGRLPPPIHLASNQHLPPPAQPLVLPTTPDRRPTQ